LVYQEAENEAEYTTSEDGGDQKVLKGSRIKTMMAIEDSKTKDGRPSRRRCPTVGEGCGVRGNFSQ